jgi:hypothetical protein
MIVEFLDERQGAPVAWPARRATAHGAAVAIRLQSRDDFVTSVALLQRSGGIYFEVWA